MTIDPLIRKEALRLYFIEGMDYADVSREIAATFDVLISVATVRAWVRGDVGRLYEEVNCVDISSDSIKKARDQERELQRELCGDFLMGS